MRIDEKELERFKTRELVLEKSTKNTYVYAEDLKPGETPLAPVIYVKKDALPTKPQRIRVTIEEVPPS